LRSQSQTFDRVWSRHDVLPQSIPRKTFDHPVVGPVTVHCDSLDIADRDRRVVIYTAEPGSSAEQALRRLAVLGVTASTCQAETPHWADRRGAEPKSRVTTCR
jgi:hypothetical protein